MTCRITSFNDQIWGAEYNFGKVPAVPDDTEYSVVRRSRFAVCVFEGTGMGAEFLCDSGTLKMKLKQNNDSYTPMTSHYINIISDTGGKQRQVSIVHFSSAD